MRCSWLDLVLYAVAVVLLAPFVAMFVEAILEGLNGL